MSHKCYEYKIVESLLKSEKHIRELAKNLNTNQMTISRKMQILLDKNVVDFKREGRNKIFFLKKTLEAYEYTIISEHNKNLDIIESYPELRILFKKIKLNNKISLAILFGSYAKEIANNDSDIDIYIETKSRVLKEEIEKISSKINVKIGVYDKKSLLIKEIEKRYIIIKGFEDFYERKKFFE